MNKLLEQMILVGEERLASKESAEALRREAELQSKREADALLVADFRKGLRDFIPDELIDMLEPFGAQDLKEHYVTLELRIEGWPLRFRVYHVDGISLHFEDAHPFEVAHLKSCEPSIYEGEVYPGRVDAKYIGYWHDVLDPKPLLFDDLSEAMAYALRQQKECVRILKENEEIRQRLVAQLEAAQSSNQ
jgi:hypothetical protein